MATEYMERLLDTDLVGRLQPYVDNQQLNYSFMGDEWISFSAASTTKTPWLFAKGIKGHLCHLMHGVYYGVFGCVPNGCFKHCWKITACNKGIKDDVVRQLTMKDIMQIEQLQLDMDVPSKCGMDRRTYSPNLWGAYWYYTSLGEAKRYYNQVKGYLNLIDPDINVTIKRSCTEFELALGPTTEWDSLDIDWVEKEAVLDEWVFRLDQDPPPQQPLIKQNVKNRMLYWAHQHGDMTYKLFNRGNDLVYSFPSEKRVPILASETYNP
jgi:hypothetical protein